MERSANRSESSRRNHFTVLFVVLLMPPVLRLPSSADIRLPGQCASRAIPTLTLKPSRPNGIFLRYAADKACPDIGSLYRLPPPPSARRDPIAFHASPATPTASPSALETQSPFTAGRTGRRSGAAACLNVQSSVACLNVQSSVACLNVRGSDRFRDRSPARPVLLREIFYVLVARSADRRAEWIKRDCPPSESRRRTICCSLTASDAFGRGSSRVTSRRGPCPAPGRPAFFLRPRQPLLWRSSAALQSWR